MERGKNILHALLLICCLFASKTAAVITFSAPQTTVYTPENSPGGTIVSKFLRATDSDGGAITYSLDDAMPDTDYFKLLQEDSSVIVVNDCPGDDCLDREAVSDFTLTLTATSTSGADPATATVRVILRDENDNTPVWNADNKASVESLAMTGIPENISPGQTVFVLFAEDKDFLLYGYGIVHYFLNGGDGEGTFTVSEFSGVVSLHTDARLDFETKPSYNFMFRVEDGGSPPNVEEYSFTLNIMNQTDLAPTFQNLPYTVTRMEGDYSGDNNNFLLTLEAVGGAGSQNIVYEIPTGGMYTGVGADVFDIRGNDVWLVKEIDTETLSSYYTFVIAHEDSLDYNTAVTSVQLQVLNLNDEIPVFTASHYSVSISETAPPGAIISTDVFATDPDQLGTLVYSFAEDSSYFMIDSKTALLSLKSTLDYESLSTTSFTLVAQAWDGMLTGSTVVEISVVDLNDNYPVFTQDSYSFTIAENNDVDQALNTGSAILATDADGGANGAVTYSLLGFGANDRFGIDNNGIVTAKVELNYEEVNQYYITVLASDGGVPSNVNTAIMKINVTNVNDISPEFSIASHTATLTEGTAVTSLITVTATDQDGTLPLIYSIAADNGMDISGLFTIDSTTGTVSATDALDHEAVAVWVLTITASDGSLTGTTSLTVNVNDFNENAPMFNGPYQASVTENAAMNTVVVTVEATEEGDPIANNDIIYQIISGNTGGAFDIDRADGRILVAGSIDYESVMAYSLTVQASDQGSPPLSGETSVEIIVIPKNDATPVITSPSDNIEYSVAEDKAIGYELVEAKASDADLGTLGHSTITFTLAANDYFEIKDSSVGSVTLKSQLSYQTASSIPLQVTACDNPTDGEAQRCSAATSMTANVVDGNNHHPMFVPESYSEDISESVSGGTSVLKVTATDEDSGLHGVIVYSILSGDEGQFTIEPSTGVIRVSTGMLDYDAGTRVFNMMVEAKNDDNLMFADNATVMISLTDANDNLPFFNQPVFQFTFTEGDPSTTHTGIGAMDADATAPNKMLEYRIMATSDETGWFAIGLTDATLSVSSGAVVDREDSDEVFINDLGIGEYSFFIEVSDDSFTDNTRTDTARVEIKIIDINDNPAVFTEFPEALSVAENTVVDTPLGTVVASDKDYASNAEIVYAIDSGNDEGKFAIDSSTGIITLAQSLDHDAPDATRFYQLTISAQNPASTELSAFPTKVTRMLDITVLNSNDNPPIFEQEEYPASVVEYNALTSVGQTSGVITVHANDADGDDTVNGQVSYSITGGNSKGIFVVHEMNGAITVDKPMMIDYETDMSFSLVITVTDLAPIESERKTDTTLVEVTVMDSNDHYPEFGRDIYEGSVMEELEVDSPVTVSPSISATDADSALFDPLVFSLTEGSPFKVGSDGSITTSQVLNREGLPNDRYELTLTATDDGNLATSTNITIVVLDANDHDPEFVLTSDELTTKVSENVTEGTTVQRVETTDEDIGVNALATYTMSGGKGDLEIVLETGDIVTIETLDRELTSFYELTVVVKDGGLVPRSSEISFTVFVTDENDNPPEFTNSTFIGSISEDVPIGTMLDLIVRANDPDEGDTVRYSLTDNSDTYFDVDEVTGRIYTTRELDREEIAFHSFAVTASDLAVRDEQPTTIVEVRILDLNDNFPKFVQQEYETNVPEGTFTNVGVLQVFANDIDEGNNGMVSYSISSFDPPEAGYPPNPLFKINEENGFIFSNVEISTTQDDPWCQFENGTCMVTLNVSASDGGDESRTSYATVKLNLIDDGTIPIFKNSSYSFGVREESDGELVGVVRAEAEGAVGENMEVTYYIMDPSTGELVTNNSMFRVETSQGNGLIYTASALNRETLEVAIITIAARTSGEPPRTGLTSVFINLVDVNDNIPSFNQESYQVTISEEVEVGTVVVRLFATDEDSGENGRIRYEIMDATETFKINMDDGTVTTSARLDREQSGSYVFNISAIDYGTDPQSSTVQLSITVQDENDNSPVFVSPLAISVSEDAKFGIVVTQLVATDEDEGYNAEIVYTFSEGATEFGPFSVNSLSGVITLSSSLDREEIEIYNVYVVASDQEGHVANRSTAAVLKVTVMDVNDNLPEIVPDQAISVEEGYPMNTLFESFVEATDRDKGENAEICFFLPQGSDADKKCDQQFCIETETGGLYLNKDLDREEKESYDLTVAVYNCEESRENNTEAIVMVVVQDVNDNPPSLESCNCLSGAAAEEAPFGTTVTTLTGVDPDSSSPVYFEITNDLAPFIVDRDTGVVTSAGLFRGMLGDTLSVDILAYDNFGNEPFMTTNVTLTVFIFRETLQIILTFNRPKDEIDDRANDVQNVVQQAMIDLRPSSPEAAMIDTMVTVSIVRVAQNDAGTVVDTLKTDIILFAHNGMEVFEPEAVIGQLESNYGVVEALFLELEFENVRPYPTISGPSLIPAWVWVVIVILACIITCLMCFFLFFFIAERRRLRKLKHRGAHSSYHSQMDQFTSGVQNPIWVSPYENWEESTVDESASQLERANPIYESQELTIEMFQQDDDDTLSGLGSRENLAVPPGGPATSTPFGGRNSELDEDDILADIVGSGTKSSKTALI